MHNPKGAGVLRLDATVGITFLSDLRDESG
jgi:hypothetical protein